MSDEWVCDRCGSCCIFKKATEKWWTPCRHFRWDDDGKVVCKIYSYRPVVCREFECGKGKRILWDR